MYNYILFFFFFEKEIFLLHFQIRPSVGNHFSQAQETTGFQLQ